MFKKYQRAGKLGIEKYIEQFISYTLYILNILAISFKMLVKPKTTHNNLLINYQQKKTFYKPASFFLINIILAQLILGFKKPPIKIPVTFLTDWPSELVFLILEYTFGILLFLFILNLLIGKNKSNTFWLDAFSAICYASTVYIPFAITSLLGFYLAESVLFKTISSLISKQQFSLEFIDYIKIGIILLIFLYFISFWVWLMYRGMKTLKININYKKYKIRMLLCFYFYLIVKIFSMEIIFFITNYDYYVVAKILLFNEIEQATTASPPDYFKAFILCEKIANTEQLPMNLRYAAKLRAITYYLGIPIFKLGDENIIKQSMEYIDKKEYFKLEDILYSYIETHLADKNDLKRIFFRNLQDNLKIAKEFRNSPSFINLPPSLGIGLSISQAFTLRLLPCFIK